MSAEPTRREIEKEGLVDRLSYPSAPGTHSTVTVLGGSGRGLKEGGAAALSSEGFTALALCYFGLDPLPPKLVEIPLEYFSKAITWLRALLAAFGVAHDSDTRWIDGELALLLGAAYPEDIRAVVDYIPSDVVWQRPFFDLQSVHRPRYSWPLEGIPFVRVAAPRSRRWEALWGSSPVDLWLSDHFMSIGSKNITILFTTSICTTRVLGTCRARLRPGREY
jgi:hypothetical protein